MSCIPHRQVRDAQLGWEGAKKKGSDCPTKAAWHCPADPISVALGGPQGLGCRVGVCVRCWGHSPRSWHHQPAACCWRRKTPEAGFMPLVPGGHAVGAAQAGGRGEAGPLLRSPQDHLHRPSTPAAPRAPCLQQSHQVPPSTR